MMIKRLLGIILILALSGVFAGCGEVYDFDTVSGPNNFATASKDNSILSSTENEASKSEEISSSEVESFDESTIKDKESDLKSQTVYITPTGKRWHLKPGCGGKNSFPTTLEKAKEKALTPCKKCAS